MKCRPRRVLLSLQLAALLTGSAAVARPAFRWIKRSIAEARAETAWRNWCSDPAPKAHYPASGDPVFWLRVPAAGLSTLVLYDATQSNLARHPCLHADSSRIGAPAVIMAHRDYHFKSLKGLAPGARIELEEASRKRTQFRLQRIEIVDPESVPAALEHAGAPLVLLTCYPFDCVGPAPQRALFWAERAKSE